MEKKRDRACRFRTKVAAERARSYSDKGFLPTAMIFSNTATALYAERALVGKYADDLFRITAEPLVRIASLELVTASVAAATDQLCGMV
jgi:hypothetical protein